ncbi:LLM class flavin-dependent oxidoreductase [Streptomyces sp. MI02-7b]|uniref:LLM class flavin-dependent oxidoreductase n=1 Tax=Streptomyces sp. MI02-7b TaxID=462941 RepID=UPI0029B72315|nr:LLM class flavin-dependent oxidoreductase [Streptomyces sp. MI02-7b]MDX3074210.1 LLM class flavin-dependent oxidoreductase [Streptomyces sp. MI02-7b]
MSTDRITSLAFLTPGNFDDEDPHTGLEETLRLFEYGERLGFDGAWVRQRHLEHGVGSAAVFLAAAAQRTRRVELGTAVIPIGYESPFRLAEDLSLADVLSQGRLQAGFSTGMPHAELLGDLVYDGDWRSFDLSYGRIARLVDNLRGRWLGGPDTVIRSPGAIQRPRLQPHNPGLTDRIWYGAGSLTSVRWAAEHGLHLLSGNIVSADGDTDDFTSAQQRILSEYRRTAHAVRPEARIALGRVVVPFDSADAATRTRYADYAAGRHQRTLAPQTIGTRRILFAPDLVGTADQILERLTADPVLASVSELRLELPYEFRHEEYEQILHDVRHLIAPELGWRPALQVDPDHSPNPVAEAAR